MHSVSRVPCTTLTTLITPTTPPNEHRLSFDRSSLGLTAILKAEECKTALKFLGSPNDYDGAVQDIIKIMSGTTAKCRKVLQSLADQDFYDGIEDDITKIMSEPIKETDRTFVFVLLLRMKADSAMRSDTVAQCSNILTKLNSLDKFQGIEIFRLGLPYDEIELDLTGLTGTMLVSCDMCDNDDSGDDTHTKPMNFEFYSAARRCGKLDLTGFSEYTDALWRYSHRT